MVTNTSVSEYTINLAKMKVHIITLETSTHHFYYVKNIKFDLILMFCYHGAINNYQKLLI